MAELTMDVRLMQARDWHRRAVEHERLAGAARDERNRIIRELVDEGVLRKAVAAAIGCSSELITHVMTGRVGPGTRGRRPTG